MTALSVNYTVQLSIRSRVLQTLYPLLNFLYFFTTGTNRLVVLFIRPAEKFFPAIYQLISIIGRHGPIIIIDRRNSGRVRLCVRVISSRCHAHTYIARLTE